MDGRKEVRVNMAGSELWVLCRLSVNAQVSVVFRGRSSHPLMHKGVVFCFCLDEAHEAKTSRWADVPALIPVPASVHYIS
jgi:hypothetical protein